MSKNTPGPWTIEHIKGLDLGASAEIMARKLVVCQVWKTDDNITRWSNDETGKANSRLIARAPEMLQLLQEAFDALQVCLISIDDRIRLLPLKAKISSLIREINPEPQSWRRENK